MTPIVSILLFPDVEVLDACGPFEVFATAPGGDGAPLFTVRTVAASTTPLRAIGGLRLVPDHAFADAPAASVLVVPGGDGRKRAMRDVETLRWVRSQAAAAQAVLSVCTGAFILAHAGLLEGLSATTHHSTFDEFAATFPDVPLRRGERFVDNGRIVTAAGVSAGIDASLHLLERLAGPAAAAGVRRNMEYGDA